MKRKLVDARGRSQREQSVKGAREDLHAIERGLRAADAGKPIDQDALGKLLSVVEQVNAEIEVENVLRVAARQIIEIFEAERVFILEVGPGDQIEFRLAVTFRGLAVPNPEREVSHAVIQEVIRNRAPILVADATTDPRFALVSSVRNL